MKSVQKAQQFFSLVSKPTITQLSIPFSSSSTIDSITSPKPKPTQTQTLTQEDLININLLLPRLCLSDHLDTATHLTITALLTNPPLQSLSLSILIHSFTSQPDMARPMSLLTRLRHNPPSHSYLTPITTMLIASYFKRKRPREAFKLFNWMVRPGSPVVLDERVCGVLVCGFCRNGMVLEALNVLRAMLGTNIVPGCGLREWVYRGLLREARIREALELNEALDCVGDCESEALKKVLALLDRLIANWTGRVQGTSSILRFFKNQDSSSAPRKLEHVENTKDIKLPLSVGPQSRSDNSLDHNQLLSKERPFEETGTSSAPSSAQFEQRRGVWSYNTDEIDPSVIEELPPEIQQKVRAWLRPHKRQNVVKRGSSIADYFLPTRNA